MNMSLSEAVSEPPSKKKAKEQTPVLESKKLVMLEITVLSFQQRYQEGAVQARADGGYYLRSVMVNKDLAAEETGYDVVFKEVILTTSVSQAQTLRASLFTLYSLENESLRNRVKYAVLRNSNIDPGLYGDDEMYFPTAENAILMAWLCSNSSQMLPGTESTESRSGSSNWLPSFSVRVHKLDGIPDGMWYAERSISPLVELCQHSGALVMAECSCVVRGWRRQ